MEPGNPPPVPPARIAAIGVAVPPFSIGQAEAGAFLAARYAGRLSPRSLSTLRKVFAHPSIRTRHFAIDAPDRVVDEDPDARIQRFTSHAIGLSAQSAREAMRRAGVKPSDLTALIVNTCTGYICPGVSTYLLEELGMSRATRVYDLVGAGCGGAVPNLELCRDILSAGPCRVVLSVAVEICSATFEMGNDLSLILSNALFADGAAAAILWNRPHGPAILDVARLYAPEHRDAIRYVHRGGRLHNHLALNLPTLLRDQVAQVVRALLSRWGLGVGDIRHWAIHPGGDKVVNAIQAGLGLSEEQLRVTRGVLADFGNMSSPTVWFEMERLLSNGLAPGDWCVMIGAGAGLSTHAVLLRA